MTSRARTLVVSGMLAAAFLAWMLTNVDQSLFGYAIPDIRTEFGLALRPISIVISLSFLAGMIIPVGVGVLTDRWGARWTLPLVLAVSAALVGVQGLAGSFMVLACARILSSGLSAAVSPICVSMVSNTASTRWRAMAMAGLQCAYPLGWFAASLLVGPLLASGGWRMLFQVGFGVVPLALCLALLIPRRGSEPAMAAAVVPARGPQQSNIKLVLSRYRRASIVTAVAFFFNSGSVAATAFYFPTFLHEVRGYDVTTAAHIVGSSYAVSVIGYFASVLVSMYLLPMRATIMLWNIIAAVLFSCMVWLPHNPSQDMLAFCATTIFFYGTTSILITAAMNCFPAAIRTTAAAVCGTAAVSFSTVVFPYVTAELVNYFGWQLSFSYVVPPALIISGLAILCLPREVAEEPAHLSQGWNSTNSNSAAI